ncbi:hypothetical protein EV126DRAFT_159523 [Verticillium dahliae]|nr:hypothetical protein EV126DRAFT_159523 [Verticillium dahliae]
MGSGTVPFQVPVGTWGLGAVLAASRPAYMAAWPKLNLRLAVLYVRRFVSAVNLNRPTDSNESSSKRQSPRCPGPARRSMLDAGAQRRQSSSWHFTNNRKTNVSTLRRTNDNAPCAAKCKCLWSGLWTSANWTNQKPSSTARCPLACFRAPAQPQSLPSHGVPPPKDWGSNGSAVVLVPALLAGLLDSSLDTASGREGTSGNRSNTCCSITSPWRPLTPFFGLRRSFLLAKHPPRPRIIA